MTTAADLYMKCQRCKHIWNVGKLPSALSSLRAVTCPGCGEGRDLELLPMKTRKKGTR